MVKVFYQTTRKGRFSSFLKFVAIEDELSLKNFAEAVFDVEEVKEVQSSSTEKSSYIEAFKNKDAWERWNATPEKQRKDLDISQFPLVALYDENNTLLGSDRNDPLFVVIPYVSYKLNHSGIFSEDTIDVPFEFTVTDLFKLLRKDPQLAQVGLKIFDSNNVLLDPIEILHGTVIVDDKHNSIYYMLSDDHEDKIDVATNFTADDFKNFLKKKYNLTEADLKLFGNDGKLLESRDIVQGKIKIEVTFKINVCFKYDAFDSLPEEIISVKNPISVTEISVIWMKGRPWGKIFEEFVHFEGRVEGQLLKLKKHFNVSSIDKDEKGNYPLQVKFGKVLKSPSTILFNEQCRKYLEVGEDLKYTIEFKRLLSTIHSLFKMVNDPRPPLFICSSSGTGKTQFAFTLMQAIKNKNGIIQDKGKEKLPDNDEQLEQLLDHEKLDFDKAVNFFNERKCSVVYIPCKKEPGKYFDQNVYKPFNELSELIVQAGLSDVRALHAGLYKNSKNEDWKSTIETLGTHKLKDVKRPLYICGVLKRLFETAENRVIEPGDATGLRQNLEEIIEPCTITELKMFLEARKRNGESFILIFDEFPPIDTDFKMDPEVLVSWNLSEVKEHGIVSWDLAFTSLLRNIPGLLNITFICMGTNTAPINIVPRVDSIGSRVEINNPSIIVAPTLPKISSDQINKSFLSPGNHNIYDARFADLPFVKLTKFIVKFSRPWFSLLFLKEVYAFLRKNSLIRSLSGKELSKELALIGDKFLAQVFNSKEFSCNKESRFGQLLLSFGTFFQSQIPENAEGRDNLINRHFAVLHLKEITPIVIAEKYPKIRYDYNRFHIFTHFPDPSEDLLLSLLFLGYGGLPTLMAKKASPGSKVSLNSAYSSFIDHCQNISAISHNANHGDSNPKVKVIKGIKFENLCSAAVVAASRENGFVGISSKAFLKNLLYHMFDKDLAVVFDECLKEIEKEMENDVLPFLAPPDVSWPKEFIELGNSVGFKFGNFYQSENDPEIDGIITEKIRDEEYPKPFIKSVDYDIWGLIKSRPSEINNDDKEPEIANIQTTTYEGETFSEIGFRQSFAMKNRAKTDVPSILDEIPGNSRLHFIFARNLAQYHTKLSKYKEKFCVLMVVYNKDKNVFLVELFRDKKPLNISKNNKNKKENPKSDKSAAHTTRATTRNQSGLAKQKEKVEEEEEQNLKKKVKRSENGKVFLNNSDEDADIMESFRENPNMTIVICIELGKHHIFCKEYN